ncbi:Uncharacterised protein [Mycobacteroides abscessus subsp. massiliense]|nr:Uncharacterised protein [Mycobacteroides abscessus subsp. massiliense]
MRFGTPNFENGSPSPEVLRSSWSLAPIKKSPKCPMGPWLVYVAVAGTPARSKVSLMGMKLMATRFPACRGPRRPNSLMLEQFANAHIDVLAEFGDCGLRRGTKYQRHHAGQHPRKRL